jgi:CheY-like chemotaxis protein
MPRLLVVDDVAMVRVAVRAAFAAAGYRVTEAASGAEALDAYRKEPADLVLCDLFMPEKDGLEVIQELTQEFPGVRIIAMSAGRFGAPDLLPDAERLGAVATIKKPFRPSAALALAARILHGPNSQSVLWDSALGISHLPNPDADA